MNKVHIKKNDMVVVLWGNDKGKAGKVLQALPGKNKVLIEGVNMVHKAVRKTQDNPKGGIVTKEAPIPASKVMLQEKYEARLKKRGVAAPATAI